MRGAIASGTADDAVDRAVLYLRPVAPRGLSEDQRRALASLRAAERRGALDRVDADRWTPPQCGTTEVLPGETPVSELLERFARWADEHDRALAPAFGALGSDVGAAIRGAVDGSSERPDRDAAAAGRPGDGVELPLTCLALWAGDELAAVYPHVDGSAVASDEDAVVATVADCLERLEAVATVDAPGA